MKSEKEIREQLKLAYEELDRIGKQELGTGAWRQQRRYLDALEWVLGDPS